MSCGEAAAPCSLTKPCSTDQTWHKGLDRYEGRRLELRWPRAGIAEVGRLHHRLEAVGDEQSGRGSGGMSPGTKSSRASTGWGQDVKWGR